MPSVLPRVNVVVSPEHYRVLNRLAELQGASMSAYVRRVLDAAMPALVRLLEPLERAAAQERLLEEDLNPGIEALLDEADEAIEREMELDLFPVKHGGKRSRKRVPGPKASAPALERSNPPILTGGSPPANPLKSNVVPLSKRKG